MATLPYPATSAVAWCVTDELGFPTGAYHDDASRSLFVSNLATAPGAADGSGSISRLTPDGRVVAAKWVTGLTAPRGLRVFKGTLYAACGDRLTVIDIATGNVVRWVPVPAAEFLSDVTVDTTGTVYVSDPRASRIYAYDGTGVTVFAEGDDLEYPNGLLAVGNQLFVAGEGTPATPGRLFALNLKTKQKTPVTPAPVGTLGGLERDERFNFLVADRAAGKVYQISPRGEVTLLLAGLPGAADLAYLPERRLLVLPRPEGGVAAYDLAKLRR